MMAQEVIAKKRDGLELTGDEIGGFISGYVRGEVADYQASAFLMATYIRGMTARETAALTRAMANSGETLDLIAGGIPADAPTLDKHSTGGVGDKTSLIVVPLMAAAGAFVCKMSGRGLGHTGGTLDKLESIPGFRIGLSPDEMVRQVRKIGACLAGQTDTLAPADKKLYSLRDATATVGCLPLIVSSILSKKLAAGAKSFLFDVKVGDGALIRTVEEAEALAHALVDGAVASGRRATAVLSDMDAPLGNAIGNALEIDEAISLLSPSVPDAKKNPRLKEICLTLAGEALSLCGISASPETGRNYAGTLLQSGAGLEKLRDIILAQGGDADVIDNPAKVLPQAPVLLPFVADTAGYIRKISARRVGEIVVRLGGGRERKEDKINPSVGMVLAKSIGGMVQRGDTIAVIHASSVSAAQEAATELRKSVQIGDMMAPPSPLIGNVLRK
ncbi:MAG: thymidine phosphorylase [Akkermansiaceae bacterium]|nr:thymidine phosphorylase [Armatimonadota bacterium]